MFLVNRRGPSLPSSFSPFESCLWALLCGGNDCDGGDFPVSCGVSGVPLGLGSLGVGGGSVPGSTCAWREAGSLITGINRVFPVGA